MFASRGRFWRRSGSSKSPPRRRSSRYTWTANDPALRRLLLLLVDNAVKYTPAGGRITVSVALDSSGPTVTVRDTGIGIPDAALPHVFERFYRVDESRNREAGGAGLGLSIAQWIAERHHARLEAESVGGRGSAFRVRFPQT